MGQAGGSGQDPGQEVTLIEAPFPPLARMEGNRDQPGPLDMGQKERRAPEDRLHIPENVTAAAVLELQ